MEASDPRYACYHCNEELVFDVKIGRRDLCPNCSSYLHACFNCAHWDPNVHNQCHENQGEFIRDRAEGNFCLYFDFKVIGEDRSAEQSEARDRLEALFSGSSLASSEDAPAQRAPSREDEARARLEALFKK